MPTGYTAKISDGITFKNFVMGCARAFGACISMRDDPSNKPIPEKFEPDNYHQERMKELELRLKKLKSMKRKECEIELKKEHEDFLREVETDRKEKTALKLKYVKMLESAEKWTPPTKDHEQLKVFMRNQINESIKWDCSESSSLNEISNLQILSGLDWKKKQIDECLEKIEYHKKEWEMEKESAAFKTKWIEELRGSLLEEK